MNQWLIEDADKSIAASEFAAAPFSFGVSEFANQDRMEDQGGRYIPEKDQDGGFNESREPVEALHEEPTDEKAPNKPTAKARGKEEQGKADEVANEPSAEKLSQHRPGIAAGEDSGMELVEGTLPIEPWRIGGPVIKGFGRGSKVLGIPTANLSAEGYSDLLQEHPCGVYFGWAGLSNRGVFKMVMSIGWNPYFNNAEKTIEPWLLHDFNEDFYGEELHLVIVGYIRPEANFSSLDSLIAKIYEDRDIAEKALELPQYAEHKNDPYLHDVDTIKGIGSLGEQ